MKNKVFYVLASVLLIAIASCSKSGNVTPVSTVTKFTLNGTEYTETLSADSSGTSDSGQGFNILGIVGTNGSAQGTVEFIFAGTAKPKAGSYKVIGDSNTSGNVVGILAFDKNGVAKNGIYSSTGKDNSTVTVSVSSSGKLSATFSSIALSGTNYDNTDSKNTVITDVTGSVSGSVVEN